MESMMKKNIRRLGLLVLFPVLAFHALADWPQEAEKIHLLLNGIVELDAVFIRNGAEHTPEQAVEHLQMKLERAQNSWFAPGKEAWTAELFIEKIASKSSISGKLYKIRFKNGKTITAREWLKKKLTAISTE